MHDITPGSQITIHYPTTRHILRIDSAPLIARDITIHAIRDMIADPLTPEEFLRRPYLQRGRWLVRGKEHVRGRSQYRQFYLASSREFARPGGLRLALYEPQATRPKSIISREFQPTVIDRRSLIRLLSRIANIDHDGLLLRVIADDFRIVA